MSKIISIGANHRTATLEERETFYISLDVLGGVLNAVKSLHKLSELMVISTCNRFEIFAVTSHPHQNTQSFCLDIWLDLHKRTSSSPPLDRAFLESKVYVYEGTDAVRQALRVAASLDSLIPGETQITGQFKESVSLSQEAKTMGPWLTRLSNEALATAKKVRSQTDIGKQTTSIAHAAVTLAKRIHQDLEKCRFLIIGAGEMARIAAEHAAGYHPASLTLMNRTRSKAAEIAERIGRVNVATLDQLQHLVSQSDVVISATSAQDYVVTKKHLLEAMQKRKSSSPLFLVDIAMPRDIDPECADLEDIYVFTIDDLRQVVDENLASRRQAAQSADSIIDASCQSFMQWIDSQAVVPVIDSWHQHLQSTVSREIHKTLSKDLFSSLDQKQREALVSMTGAIVARLTSDVAQPIRELSPLEGQAMARYIDLVIERSQKEQSTLQRRSEHLS
jgi:glutamyl-tRNA reductase